MEEAKMERLVEKKHWDKLRKHVDGKKKKNWRWLRRVPLQTPTNAATFW